MDLIDVKIPNPPEKKIKDDRMQYAFEQINKSPVMIRQSPAASYRMNQLNNMYSSLVAPPGSLSNKALLFPTFPNQGLQKVKNKKGSKGQFFINKGSQKFRENKLNLDYM